MHSVSSKFPPDPARKACNSLISRLMQQTSSLFQQANSDPNVRVVILSARGKAFSAGLDRNFLLGPVVLSWQVKDAQTTSLYTSLTGDPARAAKAFAQTVKNSQEYINSIASCTKP